MNNVSHLDVAVIAGVMLGRSTLCIQTIRLPQRVTRAHVHVYVGWAAWVGHRMSRSFAVGCHDVGIRNTRTLSMPYMLREQHAVQHFRANMRTLKPPLRSRARTPTQKRTQLLISSRKHGHNSISRRPNPVGLDMRWHHFSEIPSLRWDFN